MTKTVTIHDIARAAGVSPSTVSRVLNDTTPVAPDKRLAVLTAVDQLKYRPNIVAQGLARGKTNAIGVLTQNIASPFYGELLKGLEQGLHGSGYHPMIANGNWDRDEEHEAIALLLARRVDGLIVLSGLLDDAELRQLAEQTALVVVGRSVAGLEQRCLRVDDFQGAYQATRYLIQLGHTRIAHIAGMLSHRDAVDRRAGYCRALADAGIAVDDGLIVEGDFSEPSGLLAVEVLLMRGALFTAMVAANDQMAYGARLALYRRGIRVPEDISLIGFDDQPASAYTTPPLTTVRQPTVEMGRAAARAVLALIAGAPPTPTTFATELVIRESAALCRLPYQPRRIAVGAESDFTA